MASSTRSVIGTYDRIAESYDTDYQNIVGKTTQLAINQLRHHVPADIRTIVDFSVGTGNSLRYLNSLFRQAMILANDASSAMLHLAKTKNSIENINWLHADARDLTRLLLPGSVDLALCHYLFSYVPVETLLDSASYLLRPGGYLSIITTTKRNLARKWPGVVQACSNALKISRYADLSTTPDSAGQLEIMLSNHGFVRVDAIVFDEPVFFETFRDIKCWSYDCGWGASYLATYPLLKLTALFFLYVFTKLALPDLYPLQAASDIAIVLAKKRRDVELGQGAPLRMTNE